MSNSTNDISSKETCRSTNNKRSSLAAVAYRSVTMEYLVKVSKRRAFWSLNKDILKITILKTNTLAGRSLTQIEAYDLEVEGKYVVAVSKFEDTTPEFSQFQPYLDQVVVPIYSESGSIDREMLLSEAIPAIRQSSDKEGIMSALNSALGVLLALYPPACTLVGVMDYQVSTLVLPCDGGPTDPPPVVQPHDDLFDISVIDKSGDF
ncbi:hypothetical protein Tco_0472198 [Tanacetum coccineum]